MSVYGNQQDVVPGDQYRYALANFRIAHEKVEEQRGQLETQERQVAALRARIAALEGSAPAALPQTRQGGSSVDDVTIKTAASKLERLISRWAADTVRGAPQPALDALHAAACADLPGAEPPARGPARALAAQSTLRHALAEAVAEGALNALVVTNLPEANVELTRIHAILFARDPTVAAVWRRQTLLAAADPVAPELRHTMLREHLANLAGALAPPQLEGALGIFDAAIAFSRMLHGAAGEAFYRAFVPEPQGALLPSQVELVKRCVRTERGEACVVGACIFPGLVKVVREGAETNVTRRAQVICQCALIASAGAAASPGNSLPSTPHI